MSRGRGGTLCGRAGQGSLRKVDRLPDGVECACEIGIINRKRQHSRPQDMIFPSSIRPLQHRVEELGLNREREARKLRALAT